MHKILVVEDDKSVLEFLRHCLESEGWMVITAADGKTAMNWIKDTRFDLALLDLRLPDMDGMRICAAIKEDPKTRATPVVILTGNDSNDARIKSNLDANADLFLNKPIEPSDLKTAVSKMLEVSEKRKLRLRNSVKARLNE